MVDQVEQVKSVGTVRGYIRAGIYSSYGHSIWEGDPKCDEFTSLAYQLTRKELGDAVVRWFKAYRGMRSLSHEFDGLEHFVISSRSHLKAILFELGKGKGAVT